MRMSVLAIGLFAVLQGCAQAPVSRDGAGSVDAAVPGIARQFSECKMDELVSRYAPSIEFVSPSTTSPLIGHAAVRSYFAAGCRGAIRPIMKVETQRIQMLSAESAIVTGTYTFGRSDQPDAKPWPAFFVISLKASEGRWLIHTQATFAIPGSSG